MSMTYRGLGLNTIACPEHKNFTHARLQSKVSIQYPGRDRTLPSVLDPFFSLDRTDHIFFVDSFLSGDSFLSEQSEEEEFFFSGRKFSKPNS